MLNFLIVIALVYDLWARSWMCAVVIFINWKCDDVSEPVSLMQRFFMLVSLTGIFAVMQHSQ